MRDLYNPEMDAFDEDWYCKINGKPVHIASMCGYIPTLFRGIDKLRFLQAKIGQLPYTTKAYINQELINQEIEGKYSYLQNQEIVQKLEELLEQDECVNYNRRWPLRIRLYASSFIDKARKGFYSYARIGETNEWFLVAYPEIEFDWMNSDLQLQNLNLNNDGEMPNRFIIPE